MNSKVQERKSTIQEEEEESDFWIKIIKIPKIKEEVQS